MLELFKIAWRSPREAVRYVNKHSFKAYWLVLFLAGFGNLIFGMMDENGNIKSLDIVLALVLAIPSLWLSAVIVGFFTHLIAKWFFKGTGTFKEMRKGYYVSFLPYVIAAPVALIYIILEKTATFNLSGITIVVSLITVVLSIVAIVLEVIVISEVEQISIGRAIGTLVILLIFMFIFAFIIILLITAIVFAIGVAG